MRIAGIFCLLVLAGCFSSPRSRFYSLTPATGQVDSHGYAGPVLGLGKVALPAALDRRALMVYRSDTRLEIRDTERWAGPLDVLTRDALAVALAARLPEGSVLLPNQARPDGDRRTLTLSLHRFAAGPDQVLHLAGRWSLVEGANVLGSRSTDIEVALPGLDGAAIATAMSTAIDRLAAAIAAQLGSFDEQASHSRDDAVTTSIGPCAGASNDTTTHAR
ncbi:MAG: PqiC family protein [Planctomycetota bacterium]